MKTHLTSLYLVRHNTSIGSYPSNDGAWSLEARNIEMGVLKLESGVLNGSERGKWEIAYLYDADAPKGSPPLHCYHHSRGIQRLTKQEAELCRLTEKKQLHANFRAYIIPKPELQAKGIKPYTRFIETAEEGKDFMSKDVWKIIVYGQLNVIAQTFLNT